MKKKSETNTTGNAKKTKKVETTYHHGDLRNLVLKVADEFLEERGVHNLSLRDIASAIGVSHTAPYRHFPRKIDLLYAITTIGFRALRDTLAEAWNESEDSFEKLRRAGENYIRLMWKHPRRTELMFGGEVYHEGTLPEELEIAGKEAYMALYHIVEYGQNRDDFKKDKDTESVSMSVWSAVHGFAVLNERYFKGAKTQAEIQKLENQKVVLIDMILRGIRNK